MSGNAPNLSSPVSEEEKKFDFVCCWTTNYKPTTNKQPSTEVESSHSLPQIELDGQLLNYKQNTKFLGVYITTKLNWRLHI